MLGASSHDKEVLCNFQVDHMLERSTGTVTCSIFASVLTQILVIFDESIECFPLCICGCCISKNNLIFCCRDEHHSAFVFTSPTVDTSSTIYLGVVIVINVGIRHT